LHLELPDRRVVSMTVASVYGASSPLSAADDLDVLADRIRPHLLAAVDNIITAGNELLNAKSVLPHGQFGPLLDKLGLSRQTANRFMRVANNPVLANRSPVGGLPAAVSVLDVLTQLDDDELESALESGTVTSATTRAEAELLVDQRRQLSAYANATAAGVAAIDAMCASSTSPIQARDHFRDLALIVAVCLSRWLDQPRTDAELLIDQEWIGENWPDVVAVEGWALAAMWVGYEALFKDTPKIDVSRPFADQLIGRMAGAVDLVGAARRWYGDDERAVQR